MTVKEGNVLGETVLFSIGGNRLLGLKAAGAVPPSVLAGAARAEVETALRGRSWRVAPDQVSSEEVTIGQTVGKGTDHAT